MKKTIIFIIILSNIAASAYGFVIKGADKELVSPSYRIRGTEYLPLTLICDAYGIDWKWDPISRTVELNRGNTNLRLRVNEYKVYANGVINVQEKPVVFYNGAVCVPSNFLKTIFNRLFLAKPTVPVSQTVQPELVPQVPFIPYYRIKRIVIDAGHGGYDPGAIGRDGIKEKYIVLDIARKIKELLENEGIEVILTRHDDIFVPLWERVEVANRENADLFISIHANASRARRLKGFEVYYISEAIDDDAKAKALAEDIVPRFDKEAGYEHSQILDAILWDLELTENRKNSIELANCILEEIGIGKRRLKNAKFYVLKGVRVPAVLVEVGYITNMDECSKLGWKEYRTQTAEKIARGILEYKKRFEASDGFTN